MCENDSNYLSNFQEIIWHPITFIGLEKQKIFPTNYLSYSVFRFIINFKVQSLIFFRSDIVKNKFWSLNSFYNFDTLNF